MVGAGTGSGSGACLVADGFGAEGAEAFLAIGDESEAEMEEGKVGERPRRGGAGFIEEVRGGDFAGGGGTE